MTFDIPKSAVIGEEVTIKRTISAGDHVDIVIDDAYFVLLMNLWMRTRNLK
ncbi:MAG: hypothetical protein MW690_000278 [Methanophagales archaeon]|nr:hypothetical protein [Methanophagales archaeon]MCU4140347.1 hypothetical protein [Methanophagales archaeon]